jgi:uncharacterized protein (TIGR02147 family)
MQKADNTINEEFRIRLREEFTRRLRVNERYSIRAFANHLKLDSSTVSQIFAGKRALSEQKIAAIYKKLGLGNNVDKNGDIPKFTVMDLDSFAVISDWYHYAILDLALLKSFKSNPKWIARKLSITEFEAEGAIGRLKRLGMLVEKNGRLVKAEKFYSNYSEGVTSAALKEYQRQVIKKALVAVDECPQDLKDITSITIAADSRKLEGAKERIKKFRRELCKYLEDGEGDSVYHLTLQLYPVTNFEN